jgi:hypothetical protein
LILSNLQLDKFNVPRVRKSELLKVLTSAIDGEIEIMGRTAKLVTDNPLVYHSEMAQRIAGSPNFMFKSSVSKDRCRPT